MPRRLTIHCGLHKTGSKAIQAFLHAHAAPLRAEGVLVPRAGRLARFGHGHHNVVWELTRDRRFAPALGTVDELAAEIAAFDGDAVISSEDFETCLAAPGRFLPLLRHPALAGHEVVLLVYLRDQIGYAESLYLEKLRHGVGEACADVMSAVLTQGEWALREWRFQFDYARLPERLRAIGPLGLAVRRYVPLERGGMIADLLATLRPGLERLLAPEAAPPANPRLALAEALATFLFNRLGPHAPRDLATIALMAAPVQGRTLLLPPSVRRGFAERFGPGNVALCQAVGWPPEALDLGRAAVLPTTHAVLMDALLSFDSQVAFLRLRDMLPDRMDLTQPDLSLLSPQALDVVREIATSWITERGADG